MPSIDQLLDDYLSSRGMVPVDCDSARKVAEEAIELVEECAKSDPDPALIQHELADVVLAAAVLARHHGFTVEDAIAAKIGLDAGRGQ